MYVGLLLEAIHLLKSLGAFSLPVFIVIWEVVLLLFLRCYRCLAARCIVVLLLLDQSLVLLCLYGRKRSLVDGALFRHLISTAVRPTNWPQDVRLGLTNFDWHNARLAFRIISFFGRTPRVLLRNVLNIIFAKILLVFIQSHLRELTKCLRRTHWIILTTLWFEWCVHRHLCVLTDALGRLWI